MAKVSLENLPKEIRECVGHHGVFALQNAIVGAYSAIETELKPKMKSEQGRSMLTTVYRKLVKSAIDIGDYLQAGVEALEAQDDQSSEAEEEQSEPLNGGSHASADFGAPTPL